MTTPALEIDGLTIRFGGVTALDGVSFTVAPGSLTALIGPNGAGKTSLFNCISGIYRPTAGRVVLAGDEVGHDQTPLSACRSPRYHASA